MRSSHWRWHLDEVFVKINGERHYLWRAVDHEGEVLESFVTKRRDKNAALKFLKKTLKRHGHAKESVTDRLRSYGAAFNDLGIRDLQETGRWANNRAENSHRRIKGGREQCSAFAGCEHCRNSPQFTPRSKTISIRSAASRHAPSSSRPAPPLSLSGAAFLQPNIMPGMRS